MIQNNKRRVTIYLGFALMLFLGILVMIPSSVFAKTVITGHTVIPEAH